MSLHVLIPYVCQFHLFGGFVDLKCFGNKTCNDENFEVYLTSFYKCICCG